MALLEFVHEHTFLAIFLVLGMGHLLGRVRVGVVTTGSTAATLFCGIIISALVYRFAELKFEIPQILEELFLLLFLFATGLKVAPQFLSGLSREGIYLVSLTLISATLNFLIVIIASFFLDFEPGSKSGIISGSSTVTAVIAVATNIVESEQYRIPNGYTTTQIRANITAAYAILYIFSTTAIIMLCRYLPNISGINPISAAKRTENKFRDTADPLPGTGEEFVIGYLPADIRAYRLENSEFSNKPIKYLQQNYNISVIRVIRDDKVIKGNDDTILLLDDTVTVFGTLEKEISNAKNIGPELADESALNIPLTPAEIVVYNKEVTGRKIEELSELFTNYGFYLKAVFRQAHQLPLFSGLQLERGDILRVLGTSFSLEKAGEKIGAVLKPSTSLSLVSISLALVIGYLSGLISVPLFGIPFTLSTSGGVILAGILLGIIRTYNPLFGGPIQEASQNFMQSFGLDLFIIILALNVAPELVDAVVRGREVFSILAVGMTAGLLPSLAIWFTGLYLFKIDPIVLTGAIAGARASTPALNAAQQQFKSASPAIGFPIPYALSSIIVLIYGYIAMLLD